MNNGRMIRTPWVITRPLPRRAPTSCPAIITASDGGVVLLREADRRLGLIEALESELASSPTLCRLEQRADRKAAMAFHAVIIEKFIAYFSEALAELILDFDATDDRVHGNSQEGRFYHCYFGD